MQTTPWSCFHQSNNFLLISLKNIIFQQARNILVTEKKALYYIEKFQLKQFKVRTVLMKFLQEDSKLRPPNNPGSQFPEFP